ncbi:MAG: hypothetical protein JWQ71_787 [Pedosphaera sp.]|nr:hypothetical protein [Pedosphaera sp.]
MNYPPLKPFCALSWGILIFLVVIIGCQTDPTRSFLGDHFVIKVSGDQGSIFTGEVSTGGKKLPVSGSVPMNLEFTAYRVECWFDVNGTNRVRFDVYENERFLGSVEATGSGGTCHIVAQGRSMVGLNSTSKLTK